MSVLCLIANPAEPALDSTLVAAIQHDTHGEINWLNPRIACEIIKLAPIEAASAPQPSEAERALFELTPPELLTEIVTEEGATTADCVGSLVDRTPFLREGYALLLPTTAL